MTKLLAMRQVRDRFPEGAQPSERLLRETAQRLGLGRRWGHTFYVTEDEATTLMLAGSEREPAKPVRVLRPARRSDEAKRLAERTAKLEKYGLLPKAQRK